jgi:Fe2+ or Zn2+ uptake regulation protein
MLAAERLSARKIHQRLLDARYSVSLPTVSKIAKTARAEAA